jgi:hypothetical protein
MSLEYFRQRFAQCSHAAPLDLMTQHGSFKLLNIIRNVVRAVKLVPNVVCCAHQGTPQACIAVPGSTGPALIGGQLSPAFNQALFESN